MTVFGSPITCATCGGPLGLVNGRSNGLLSVAILECPACEREWEITARMAPHGPSRAAVERAQAAKYASNKASREREMVPA